MYSALRFVCIMVYVLFKYVLFKYVLFKHVLFKCVLFKYVLFIYVLFRCRNRRTSKTVDVSRFDEIFIEISREQHQK